MVEKGMRIFGVIATIIALTAEFASGQLTENFSDGNISHGPEWLGDTALFIVSSSSAFPSGIRPGLQLRGGDTDTTCIYTPLEISGYMEWSFWIKLSFNSSANNYARVYINASGDSIKKMPPGYFLEIGGADDSIRLCKTDGTDTWVLITAVQAVASSSTNDYYFRITYGPNHRWSLYSGELPTGSLVPEGTATDTMIAETGYFGLFFRYTSSNATKFYFDELYAGELQIDTVAPEVAQIYSCDRYKIKVSFNENIDTSLFQMITCSIEENKDTCLIQAGKDGRSFQALTSHPLVNGTGYTLSLEGVCDLSGNCLEPLKEPFVHYLPMVFDLCITEIMPDPFPGHGLPPLEYLEIFNRSEYTVYTGGMSLTVDGIKKIFREDISISPGEYIIVCHELDTSAWITYGRVIGLPGLTLSNSSGTLVLRDERGNFISGIGYSYSSRPDHKSEGGWSLEMIDIENPCIKEINWEFSNEPAGGTPGRENSMTGPPSHSFSFVANACVQGPGEIYLTLNVVADSLLLSESSSYIINDGKSTRIDSVAVMDELFSEVLIYVDPPMEEGTIYHLGISELLTDACHRTYTSSTILLGLPSPPTFKDIVINEVLFNPLGDGVDFVELYNRSHLIFDVSRLFIASVTGTEPSPPDTISRQITSDCRLLLPGQYLVMSKDPQKVAEQYQTCDPRTMVITDLPSLKNSGGHLMLKDERGMVIDEIVFSEEMHFPLLRSVEGVSLELINPDHSSGREEEWQSASEMAGFGTPGVKNSQYAADIPTQDEITVSPHVFSPDGDGYGDILSIHYSFGLPGFSGSVTVFSESGVRVRQLVCNDLLGVEGVLYWDGNDEMGSRAPFGIYIVLVEIFDMQGNAKRYKKAVGLTDRRYLD